jgi:hypothetical protein
VSGSLRRWSCVAAVAFAALGTSATVAHARASQADQLLSHVPDTSAVVIATNHKVLGKHAHYTDVLRFLVSQGWGSGLELLSSRGLDLVGDAGFTVNFRTATGGDGLVLKIKDLAGLRARAKSAAGAAFETGEIAGHPSFRLSKKLRVVGLPGGVILVGSEALLSKALGAVKKGKVILKKRSFKRLSVRAQKMGGAVWGVAFLPKSLRARLTAQGSADVASIERIAFGVAGLGPTTLKVESYAADAKGAKAALAAIESKIDRKILGSTILNALGAGILVRQIHFATAGARVDAKMTLTAPQVGLLSRLAQRIVSAL